MSVQAIGEVRANREFPTMSPIRKYAGTSHGLTLLVLSASDVNNKGLRLDMRVASDSQLQDFAGQINDVMNNSQVSKFYVRSVKLNGVFQDSFNGWPLVHNDTAPVSKDEYLNGSNVLVDIDISASEHVWRFYRHAQPGNRVLRLFTSEA